MLKKLVTLVTLITALSISGTGYASIVLTGTRVIYPAEQKYVNVQLTNVGEHPALIQSWIDDGNDKATPDQVKTPFIITPPIFRVEKQSGQTLRITYTGSERLPEDRESIFYLNVLEIPPKPTFTGNEESQNYLQIAVRTRVKLFYRPNKLTISPQDAYSKVQWRFVPSAGKNKLSAHNPTPYFITFNQIAVGQGKNTKTVKATEMIPPFSDYTFELNGAPVAGSQVYWTVINDYGGKQKGETSLTY